jgi:hypothetical protein
MAQKQATLSAYEPSLRERIGWSLSDFLAPDNRTLWHYLNTRVQGAADFAPGLGELLGVDDTARAAKAGKYGEAAMNAGLMAVGAVPVVGDAAGQAVKKGIRAFHGSPHSFDKFSMGKIGTGEGAQAYGHGLYFAENEGVAKSYRDDLTAMRVASAQRLLERTGGDVDSALQAARAEIERLNALPNAGGDAAKRDRFIALQEEKIAELTALKNSGSMSSGSMYEVNIAADPKDMLPWDEKLTPEMLEKIRPMVPPEKQRDFDWQARVGMSGKDAYQEFLGAYLNAKRPKVSEDLAKVGIPGIKYLDAGSRGNVDTNDIRGSLSMWETALRKSPNDAYAQQQVNDLRQKLKQAEAGGSRNYVVFDDRLIEIVKKYGIAAALGAGLISEEMARQMQEQGIEGT